MEKQLPKNWVKTELGLVAEVTSGYGFPIKYQGFSDYEIPFFKVGDISENFKKGNVFLTTANNYINEEILKTIKAKKLSAENIVFAKIGEAIRLNRRAITTKDCVVDNNVMALKFNYNVLFKYGYYFFQTVTLIDLSAGNAVPSIRKSVVEELDFPLPPLAEQNRIVAKLDTLFTQLETIKASMAKIPVLLKEFRQQVLTQAVTGKLTEEWRKGKELVEWNNVLLNDICSSITDGDHQAPPQVNEGIPFLVISNVSKGYFEFDKVSRFVPKEYYNSLKDTRKPRKGDVLYTVTGSYGIPLLVDFNKEFCFQRHIAILRPDVNKVSSNFLKIILQSDLILHQSHNVATGTAQLTVPLGGIKKFEIDLPILNEQQEIVSRVESLFVKADAIEQQYQLVKEKIDNLPQALLHKAFKGELTEQLESDGDARELLLQIQELKNSTVKPKKATSKKVKKYPENETVLGMVAEE